MPFPKCTGREILYWYRQNVRMSSDRKKPLQPLLLNASLRSRLDARATCLCLYKKCQHVFVVLPTKSLILKFSIMAVLSSLGSFISDWLSLNVCFLTSLYKGCPQNANILIIYIYIFLNLHNYVIFWYIVWVSL